MLLTSRMFSCVATLNDHYTALFSVTAFFPPYFDFCLKRREVVEDEMVH